MSLSCMVYDMDRDSGQNSPILIFPPVFGAPVGVTLLKFR